MRLKTAIQQIDQGDILLFRRSRTLFGRLIRIFTQSPYSHVGIAMWITSDGTRRLSILEALEGVGVRLHPLDRYLEECHRAGCLVDWHKIDDYGLPYKINRDRLVAFALRQWGKPYASSLQFVWSYGHVCAWLRHRLGWKVDADGDARWFCSKLVAAAAKYAGYEPDSLDVKDPAETEPGWVAMYPFIRRMGTIESD